MDIVIPLFDRFTALDAVGPYEVLSRLPGARVVFAAVEARPYTTETRMLTLSADAALADLPHPEVIVVPGGTGTDEALGDERLVGWIRTAHESSDGPPPSAPARCCSAPPGSSRASKPRPTGSTSLSSSASARLRSSAAWWSRAR